MVDKKRVACGSRGDGILYSCHIEDAPGGAVVRDTWRCDHRHRSASSAFACGWKHAKGLAKAGPPAPRRHPKEGR